MNCLPDELIVQFYSVYSESIEEPSLDRLHALRDRVRGMAVCKSWYRALRGAPLPHLYIHSKKATQLVEWVIRTQPRVQSLTILCELKDTELGLLLGSLPRQDLESLNTSYQPRRLPRLLDFPNLRRLCMSLVMPSHAPLDRLNGLPRLQELVLNYALEDKLERSLTLSHLEHVTTLQLASVSCFVATDEEPHVLRVVLSDLPSLLDLWLQPADEERVELVAGSTAADSAAAGAAAAGTDGRAAPSPSRLSCLRLTATNGMVDFAAMPYLSRAELVRCEGVEGLPTLAAATSLTALTLGEREDDEWADLNRPWVAQALRCAPTSLRRLTLSGDWGQEAANALARMAGLRVLELLVVEMPPLPAAEAPVWRGLRAFRLVSEEEEVGVPKGLVHASQLEWLQLGFMLELQPQYACRLAAIPSLHHLWMELDNSDPHFEAALVALSASMPRLQSLRGMWRWERYANADVFWQGALAAVGCGSGS